ncbi:hypothetical protein ACHAW6_009440 [Cyclotella cf. meneghiniana]
MFQPSGHWYNARDLIELLKLVVTIFWTFWLYFITPVRNYERLAMLPSIWNVVDINPDWKDECNKKALECCNLDCLIEIETIGLPVPDELTMDALLGEDQERAGGCGN